MLVAAGLWCIVRGMDLSPVCQIEIDQGDRAMQRGDWMEAVQRYCLAIQYSPRPISEALLAKRAEAVRCAGVREQGRRGGLAKSKRRAMASRENGKKGGRPRKG
jgi:hypothetical protein